MGITIGSNILSLRAQRQLGQAGDRLGSTFERLSSGQRINRASDDAAGLAISETLNVNSKVYAQAVRNINDGLSLLNIAEGAVRELSSIVVRQKELAEQAANGVLSYSQRLSLDKEANELVAEYNRIVQTTTFNGRSMLTSSDSAVRIQVGYGEDAMLNIDFAPQVATVVGDGTFGERTDSATSTSPSSLAFGDFNGDGVVDMATGDWNTTSVSVMLGNGNGTFKARTSFSAGANPSSVALGDLNGDGVLDVVVTDNGGGTVSMLLGNGDGTFQARVSFATGSSPNDVILRDLNGDGALDITTVDSDSDTVSVMLGDGYGNFSSRISVATGDYPMSIAVGDLNGDGKFDIVTADNNNHAASVLLGNGNGTFQARTSVSLGSNPNQVILGDLDGDGFLDLVSADASVNSISVLFGNGDGTFKARISYATADSPQSIALGDLNGDGALDMVVGQRKGNSCSVFMGVGDGTFTADASYAIQAPLSVTLVDLDGNGVLDLAAVSNSDNRASVWLGNSITTTIDSSLSQGALDLRSRSSALTALDTLEDELTKITQKLGDIGVVQSRLAVAAANLSVMRENVISASSRITDADVAQESAQLVRNQILQQVGSAVLSQANQAPALALMLLKSG